MRFAFGGALFATAIAFQIRGTLILMKMKDEVNQGLLPDAQVPEFGPNWLKGTVIKAHRRLYPASNLSRSLYRSWWATCAAFIAALACVVRFV
jgi:hypothetical protein